jgi:hypothetical protein
MAEIENARARREAVQKVAARRADVSDRARDALARYLGVALYEANPRRTKADAGAATKAATKADRRAGTGGSDGS